MKTPFRIIRKQLLTFLLIFGTYFSYSQSGILFLELKTGSEAISAHANVRVYQTNLSLLFETDSDGKLTAALPVGKYQIEVFKRNYAFKDSFEIKLSQTTKVFGELMETKTKHEERLEYSDFKRVEVAKSLMMDRVVELSSEVMAVPSSVSASKSMAGEGYIMESVGNKSIKSGTLTAGELNDFSKWELWKDINLTDLKNYQNVWKITPNNRISFVVQNNDGFPIVDAKVELYDSENLIYVGKTDNNGRAELWTNLFQNQQNTNLNAVISKNEIKEKVYRLKTFENGVNFVELDLKCSTSNLVEIAFIVDATGSMGDEIEYLKTELIDVINRTKSNNPKLEYRLGSVFYRDRSDEYVTKISQLSPDLNRTIDFIKNQRAAGGGDFPEAIDEAMEIGEGHLNWSKNARTRIAFLVLDAPPHESPENIARIEKTVKSYAEKGIRVVPIVGSGVNKSFEYLFRSIALATNGTYVFLTDDSGVGGSHLKPTTDDYSVEKLNDLLVRLIDSYVLVSDCNELFDFHQTSDTSEIKINNDHTKNLSIKAYPNPTVGPLEIEFNGKPDYIYISDNTGKVIMQLDAREVSKISTNLSNYPSGYYLVRFYEQALDRWYSTKIFLRK